jgi:antitoxin YefM
MKKKVSYSEARKNLKTHLDMICDSHEPLLVERRNGEDVVILSAYDYSALEETAYLLKSPKNAQRLLEAINRAPKEQIKFKNIGKLKHAIGI